MRVYSKTISQSGGVYVKVLWFCFLIVLGYVLLLHLSLLLRAFRSALSFDEHLGVYFSFGSSDITRDIKKLPFAGVFRHCTKLFFAQQSIENFRFSIVFMSYC